MRAKVCQGSGHVGPAAVLVVMLAGWAGACLAAAPAPKASPQGLGFQQFYKCPSDRDVDRVGDTITPQACLAACSARPNATACWWLDGTGGFPRQCRVCRTQAPIRQRFPNDWAMPLKDNVSS